MSNTSVEPETLTQMQEKFYKRDNVCTLDEEGIREPTALKILEQIEIHDEELYWPRDPLRYVLNIDQEITCRVLDNMETWDMSKSKTVELMLKIAIGELERARSQLYSDPENYQLKMEKL